MEHEITKELARFTVETRYPDIPDNVLDFAKGLTLKTTAGMLAGSTNPASRKISNLIKDRNLPEDVGVIGCGFMTSLWEGVLSNAYFAHASELEDDSFYEGGISWDITVIPLLLPLAQKLRLSGKAFMEALAVGLEVHFRTCLFSPEHLGQVIVPGAIGPAAAAARALGLDVEETAAAFGFAVSAPPILIPSFGTDAHYLESSLQALQACIGAEMAKEKMQSNPDITGYLSKLLGEGRINPSKIVAGLGQEWLFTNIWIKKYPCCFINHRQIDLIRELRGQHNLSFEDVEKIEVHSSPADEPCNRPEPKTLGDLQFSFQHILGAAMLDGDVNFSHIDPDILQDAKYREARSKVEVVLHPDRSSAIMEAPAQLTIRTKDGREICGERMYPIGSPQEPLSMEQFRELYVKFSSGFLSKDQIDRTAEILLNLEKATDVLELMDILTFRHQAG
jgi:2-methylcitrate dehydratase PrpD